MRDKRIKLLAGLVVVAALIVMVLGASRNTDDKPTLIAVGDSYASGEGLSPYEPETDTRTDRCHRSQRAYPELVGERLDLEVTNVACSGARINALTETNQTEAPQLTDVEGVDVVLVMVGGNDVDALSYVLQPDISQFITRLPELERNLISSYENIERLAGPDTQVVAVGYPAPVSQLAEGKSCAFSAEQVAALQSGTTQLNATVARAASTAGVEYVDMTNAFSEHGLCDSDPWINGVDITNLEASLHPNAAGHERMAEIVATQLEEAPQ